MLFLHGTSTAQCSCLQTGLGAGDRRRAGDDGGMVDASRERRGGGNGRGGGGGDGGDDEGGLLVAGRLEDAGSARRRRTRLRRGGAGDVVGLDTPGRRTRRGDDDRRSTEGSQLVAGNLQEVGGGAGRRRTRLVVTVVVPVNSRSLARRAVRLARNTGLCQRPQRPPRAGARRPPRPDSLLSTVVNYTPCPKISGSPVSNAPNSVCSSWISTKYRILHYPNITYGHTHCDVRTLPCVLSVTSL